MPTSDIKNGITVKKMNQPKHITNYKTVRSTLREKLQI